MARRNGRKGDHLACDDYTGITTYASRLKKDYWGSYAEKPLLRNLQEIATPLDDPGPVDIYRGPTYEVSVPCDYETAPLYVGHTTVRTNPNNIGVQVLDLFPVLGDMAVGCTFIVYPG